MSKKKIYLISGLKRSGKDTFGGLLANIYAEHGHKVELLSFAAPMKFILATTLGISMDELDTLKDTGGCPHRGYLQRLGTEAMKPVFGEDVWANLAREAADESHADIVIFTDYRFPSESNIFPEAITINVERGDVPAGDVHISENALKDTTFDFYIENNSSLEELREVAKDFINAQEIT